MCPLRRLLLAAAVTACGCGGSEPRAGPPTPIPVDVLADTGRTHRLRIEVPDTAAEGGKTAVWLARVTPTRPARIEAELPEPAPSGPDAPFASPPGLVVDPGLKPPLLRARGTLRVPAQASGAVDLDVRVSEEGSVSEASWAGGSSDSALVAAAIACALEMRFYPALRAGTPVAVWCRQRFEFGSR